MNNREIEKLKQKRNDEQNNFDEIQKDFYRVGSDIASCEKDIEHNLETEVSRKEALSELLDTIKSNESEVKEEEKKYNNLLSSIKKLESEINNNTNELSKLEKEKKDANFAMQNLQSQNNIFITEQSETIKEREVEKAKYDASEKSINLLSKRLGILETFSMHDNEKNDNKDELLGRASDVQEKISALLVDFDRYDNSEKNSNIKNFKISLKSILQIFKGLFDNIKALVRSQKDEIKDIKKKISDYKETSFVCQDKINILEDQIKEHTKRKEKFDKERIDLKQIIDKVEWSYDESQKLQNQLNVDISKKVSEKNAIETNIQKLKISVSDMNDRKLMLLSTDDKKVKPTSNMKDKLKKDDVVVVIFHDHGSRYVGKMFNDDWVRDRGFMDDDKVTAGMIIQSHGNKKLITASPDEELCDVLEKMTKYDISQVPVEKEGEFIGSISDAIFSEMIKKPELKTQKVETVMDEAYEVISAQTPLHEVAALLNKKHRAVLVKDRAGLTHIITIHDVLEAMNKR